jgi:transcriptional regulator GlxA family with amidase domain
MAKFLPETTSFVPVPCEQLWHAIEGACAAAAAGAMAMQADPWVRIIHEIIVRIFGADFSDPRLGRLWATVSADLSKAWTLPELARVAGMNKETLRRICLRTHTAGPMHQLARLRMQRAAELISTSSDKFSSIAERVGYGDAFSFSVAFKREIGMAPAAYRRKAMSKT